MKNLIVSRNPAKKRRTAKQKAASRRNIKKAQAARRRGGRRRRRNPTATGTYTRSVIRPVNRTRNPRPRMPTLQSIINNQVIPAAVGGTGAVLNDLVVNFLPLPAQFKSGWMRHITKAIGAIAIGFIGPMILPKRTADQLGAGAMTVVGYNVVRDLAAQFMPQLPLGEYLPMGEYLDPALGYYGAGLNPSTVPGAGLETAGQFTRGSPYLGDGLDAWPTGSAYEDIQ